ncbi:MAG TPA: VPDSG-CTERM sorting domain-containing protein [Chthoniobacterales bacterium]|jgi:hypothetical protein
MNLFLERLLASDNFLNLALAPAPTPDSGTTILLLGLGIVGVTLVHRFVTRKARNNKD